MDSSIFHECKVEVKALFERAEKAHTVSELCDISYDLGRFAEKVEGFYQRGLFNDAAYRSVKGDVNELMDLILCREVTE